MNKSPKNAHSYVVPKGTAAHIAPADEYLTLFDDGHAYAHLLKPYVTTKDNVFHGSDLVASSVHVYAFRRDQFVLLVARESAQRHTSAKR